MQEKSVENIIPSHEDDHLKSTNTRSVCSLFLWKRPQDPLDLLPPLTTFHKDVLTLSYAFLRRETGELTTKWREWRTKWREEWKKWFFFSKNVSCFTEVFQAGCKSFSWNLPVQDNWEMRAVLVPATVNDPLLIAHCSLLAAVVLEYDELHCSLDIGHRYRPLLFFDISYGPPAKDSCFPPQYLNLKKYFDHCSIL